MLNRAILPIRLSPLIPCIFLSSHKHFCDLNSTWLIVFVLVDPANAMNYATRKQIILKTK